MYITDNNDAASAQEQLGSMPLRPAPESVAKARRWFVNLTASKGLSCSVDDCVLMISELVTNAVMHSTNTAGRLLHVESWRVGKALRVDVHSPGAPNQVRIRQPAPEDETGRGLQLVNRLADSWQVGTSHYGGTVVSFRLDHAW